MAQFRYTIVDQSGKRITQLMTAGTRDEVVSTLNKQGFVVIEVLETGKSGGSAKRLRPGDMIFFTQNISVLLSAGVPLGESLSIIADDTQDKRAKNFYKSLVSDLERGMTFSKALAQYPDIFDSVYISLIEAGENSGKLDEILANLSDRLEKDQAMGRQVKSAMLYPALVLFSLVILGGLIMFFVLPKITKVFEQLNVQLPATTRFLVWLSKVLTAYPLFIGLGLAIFLILLALFSRTLTFKHLMTRLSYMTPFIKPIMVNLDLTRLSGILALLLNAGVPIHEAIRISSSTVKNPKLRAQFTTTSEKLSSGTALGQALQETSLPKTFTSLVAVGERSGKIASVFATMAAHYNNLLDAAVKNFTGILEPGLTLLVGLLVGGGVITIMLPIYRIIGNLN